MESIFLKSKYSKRCSIRVLQQSPHSKVSVTKLNHINNFLVAVLSLTLVMCRSTNKIHIFYNHDLKKFGKKQNPTHALLQ